MNTLLDKARAAAKDGARIRIRFSPEHTDLLMAFIAGEINTHQICAALGMKDNGMAAQYRMMVALRQSVDAGLIVVRRVSPHPQEGNGN